MYKVVYNSSFGGFDLSGLAVYILTGRKYYLYYTYIENNKRINIPVTEEEAIKLPEDYVAICTEKPITEFETNVDICNYKFSNKYGETRHDPELVKVVEDLGKRVSSVFSDLKVKEINSRLYKIDDYDGKESIIEVDDEDIFIIPD